MSISDNGQDEFLKYRWEFLRRHEGYKKDWKELRNSGNKAEWAEFCGMYNIYYSMPPHWSYDDLYYREKLDIPSEYPPLGIHRLISPMYGLPVRELTYFDFNRLGHRGAEETMMMLWEECEYEGKVRLQIDLFNSKAKLLKIIDELVDKYQRSLKEERGAEFKRKQRKGLSKPHYKNFDEYLAVYDLKKEGITSTTIYRTLGLNGLYMVRDYYNAACKLIKHGLNR
jgi:hypothetical protein